MNNQDLECAMENKHVCIPRTLDFYSFFLFYPDCIQYIQKLSDNYQLILILKYITIFIKIQKKSENYNIERNRY